MLGGDYNTQINNRGSMGAGVGLNLRYGFCEDAYHAPRSFVDFSLQYRLKIGGDDRAKGVFFNASFNYQANVPDRAPSPFRYFRSRKFI